MWKFYKILFFNSLIMGTLIAISSYSWFTMWIGLEINLLSMIPLMNDYKNLYPSEAALKYFITQALASTILLFSVIFLLKMTEFLIWNMNYWMLIIFNSSLLLKVGAAPFHAWFPEVMEGLNWINCLIMLIWQKIAPMMLLMYNFQMSYLFYMIIISSFIGGIFGLNQMSLRKIMTYSSINHISWMLASMMNSQTIWFIYFMIYSVITINIILIFWILNIFYMKQLLLMFNYNKNLKFFFILNFLSLGGLPPFLGFFPKWLTINNLIQNYFYSISFLLIIFTLITLFFYLRIMFSSLLINMNETLIFFNKKIYYTVLFFNFLSLIGLLSCTFIFNIY
uniref:NADH-ubiquinone oxidoreductase chain 2 n=1 Tax=Spondylis buprestoides TaxID=1395520 RepID=A0A7H0R0B2_9CUCU|nr:NADH dehydrogenase subunit 2 [Spondylis buprestoides]QNQ64861.1 NADH dehydrogenase subunit 2 [Spondylis buprestoides]